MNAFRYCHPTIGGVDLDLDVDESSEESRWEFDDRQGMWVDQYGHTSLQDPATTNPDNNCATDWKIFGTGGRIEAFFRQQQVP